MTFAGVGGRQGVGLFSDTQMTEGWYPVQQFKHKESPPAQACALCSWGRPHCTDAELSEAGQERSPQGHLVLPGLPVTGPLSQSLVWK